MIKSDHNQVKDTDSNADQFAEFWGPLMPQVRTLKFSAHFCSWISQIYTIHLIVQSQFQGQMKWHLILVSLAFAAFLSYVIEMGISKFFPFFSRVIVRQQFKTMHDKIMFALVILLLSPFVYISPTFSGMAGQTSVESLISEVDHPGTEAIELNYQNEANKTRSYFDSEKQIINTNFDSEVATVQKDFAAKASTQDLKIDKYKDLQKKGFAWASDHITIAKKEKLKLESQLSTKISAINKKRSTTLSSLYEDEKQELRSRTEDKNAAVAMITNKFQSDNEKRKNKVGLFGPLSKKLFIAVSLLIMVLISIEEIYKFASGIKNVGKKDQQNEWIAGHLFRTIYYKITNSYWSKYGKKKKEEYAYFKRDTSEDEYFEIEVPIDESLQRQISQFEANFSSAIETQEFKELSKSDIFKIKKDVLSYKAIPKLIKKTRNTYRNLAKTYKHKPTWKKEEQRCIYFTCKHRLTSLGFEVIENTDGSTLNINEQHITL